MLARRKLCVKFRILKKCQVGCWTWCGNLAGSVSDLRGMVCAVQESGSSELSVGDRVLVGGVRVEVEVPGDERTSTPAVVKDLGRCLTLPAAACRLIVVIGVICSSVWRVSI